MRVRITDGKILGEMLAEAQENGAEYSDDVAEALITVVGELYSGCLLPLEPVDGQAKALFAELDGKDDWWR